MDTAEAGVEQGAGPKDELRDLLMQVLELLGPSEGEAPMPEGEPMMEEAAPMPEEPMPEPGVPGAEASGDPKAKLLAMLKAKGGMQ